MKVLVACEFSGIVREAFKAKGHDAWSCDLLPTEIPGQHIQGDVLGILDDGWDLMIAHPPCTYLSYAGNGWLKRPGRLEAREEALKFFMSLINAPINKIAVENPRGYPMQAYRKPDQIIDPYMFGNKERKKTCLWLKNLPLLNPTVALFFMEEPMVMKSGEYKYFTDKLAPSPDRWKIRSRTFKGIAEAMAEQWGNI